MRKLTKIITPTLIAITALGGATAASAHSGYGDSYDRGPGRTPVRADNVRFQLAELQHRVDRSDRHDRISEREARGLRRDIADAREQFRRYNRDGLDHGEYRHLQARIDRIRDRLHMERADWDGRRG